MKAKAGGDQEVSTLHLLIEGTTEFGHRLLQMASQVFTREIPKDKPRATQAGPV